ncbi:MAG: oligosaccharide flippase family protein [Fidelibacterota bacterium]
MAGDIRKLGSQTLIYGTGYIVTRMLNFFLLPFYSHLFHPSQYGVASLVFSGIAFLNIIYHYGLDSAFLRFYTKKGDYQREEAFTAAFFSLLCTGIVLSLLLFINSAWISRAFLGSSEYERLIRLASGILLMDTLVNIPLHTLRMNDKAITFTFINLANVILNMSLNIWLIRFKGMGLEGIFWANIAASSLSFILLLPVLKKNLKAVFNTRLFRKMLRFGLPFVPGGMASMVLELIDRYMLRIMVDYETVGLYSTGYKLGIFMLIVVMGYKFAWQPFFLNKADDPQAPTTFGRVFTVFNVMMALVFLGVTLFIHDFITLRIFGITVFGQNYWQSEHIVPVILGAYIFLGMYINFLPSIYFSEKTGVIPLISGSAALLNVILNYFLIQSFGMTGAAWATFLSYLWMAGLTYFVVRRWYAIPYNWKKVFLTYGLLMVVLLVYYLGNLTALHEKAGLFLVYAGSLFFFKIGDFHQIRRILKRE